MDVKIYERFHKYLSEVVVYYQKNGSLKNFSIIAKKWGVKAVTKDLFYKYNLHNIKMGYMPSREISDEIRNVLANKDSASHKKHKFHKDDIVAWERNGFRSVAHIREDNMFSICLNYRGREDEQNRIWECDALPIDVKIEKANVNDLKRLALYLIKDCYKENLQTN